MKLNEVQVGARYHAKVSGRLQVVRVTELKEVAPARWSPRARAKTLILAVNEATGRLITIRSPVRLRPLPGKGCEFCNQPYNRGTGEWKCPYCGKGFPATT
jgi:hypothetical protein